MYILTMNPHWRVGNAALRRAETLEEIERVMPLIFEDAKDGEAFYLFRAEVTPVMKYDVVREVRGGFWDGPSDQEATD